MLQQPPTTNNVGSTNFTGGAMNKFSNYNSRGVMNGGSTTTGSVLDQETVFLA